MLAVLCVHVAMLYGPCASGNHRVDGPSTSLLGGHATRLQCIDLLIASLVEQYKRSEIPLDDPKAHVMLLEYTSLIHRVQRLAVLFSKLSDRLHLAYVKLLVVLDFMAYLEVIQTFPK